MFYTAKSFHFLYCVSYTHGIFLQDVAFYLSQVYVRENVPNVLLVTESGIYFVSVCRVSDSSEVTNYRAYLLQDPIENSQSIAFVK